MAYQWAKLYSVDEGDQVDMIFRRPDDSEFAHLNWEATAFRYGAWNAGIGLPDVPEVGVWKVDFQINGAIIASDSFEVLARSGDYNGDGIVDAADYTVWRDTVGSSVPPLTAADGNGDGIVDDGDFEVWRKTFRQVLGGNAVAARVPEPNAITNGSAILAALILLYRKWCRSELA